jgi:hypothetical protein
MGAGEVRAVGLRTRRAACTVALRRPSYQRGTLRTGTYDFTWLAFVHTSSGFPIPVTDYTNYRVGLSGKPHRERRSPSTELVAAGICHRAIHGKTAELAARSINSSNPFSGASCGPMLSLSVGQPRSEQLGPGNMLFLQAG